MMMGAAQANAQAGRFVMEKTDEGYVRMDTQTGDISVCAMQSGQIVCKLAADERAAFQDELGALEDRIAALEALAGNGTMAPAADGLPAEEEFERGMDYMERFFERFKGIIESFDEQTPADRT